MAAGRRALTLGAVALAGLLAAGQPSASERVTSAIVLAVDVSGSVDVGRYEVQRAGLAAVFSDPAIVQVLGDGLAVAVMEWSDGNAVVVPWTVLRSFEDARALSARIAGIERTPGIATELSLAIYAAADLLDRCPCLPDYRVIDISGDGQNNGPVSTWIARDQVVARGITVNGLPIVTPAEPDLADWYAENVVGGEGAILEVAQGFEDFARAMRQKFSREVAGRPSLPPERQAAEAGIALPPR